MLNITNTPVPSEYYGFIYKTIFPNGKIYIGQTEKEVSEVYFGSGVKFKKAVKHFGEKNLRREILKFTYNLTQYNAWEGIYNQKFDVTNPSIGYNILPGTANGFKCNPMHLQEIKEKAIEKIKLSWTREKRQKLSKKMTGQKRGANHKKSVFKYGERKRRRDCMLDNKIALGNLHTEEWKKKESERQKIKGNPMQGKRFITDGVKNKVIILDDNFIMPNGWRFGMIHKKSPK